MSAELIAQAFHDRYEALAPEHGWETQARSRKAWADVPEENRRLMVAVVEGLLADGVIHVGQLDRLERDLAVASYAGEALPALCACGWTGPLAEADGHEAGCVGSGDHVLIGAPADVEPPADVSPAVTHHGEPVPDALRAVPEARKCVGDRHWHGAGPTCACGASPTVREAG